MYLNKPLSEHLIVKIKTDAWAIINKMSIQMKKKIGILSNR